MQSVGEDIEIIDGIWSTHFHLIGVHPYAECLLQQRIRLEERASVLVTPSCSKAGVFLQSNDLNRPTVLCWLTSAESWAMKSQLSIILVY